MPEVTLDEMEEAAGRKEESTAPKAKAAETKLDFDDIPDALKGRNVSDVVAELERTQKALRMSEDARMTMRRTLETGEQAPPKEEEPEKKPLTREQLKELITEDPLAAYDYMQNSMIAALDDHLSNRFEPLVRGTVNAMENQARDQYKDEFALFGDQIEAMKKKINPGVLSTKAGWDDMMAYIRGLPQNFDTIINHRTKPRAEEARTRQREDAGFSANRSTVVERSGGGDTGDVDATTKEIAVELYMGTKDSSGRMITTPEQALAEYKRWQ